MSTDDRAVPGGPKVCPTCGRCPTCGGTKEAQPYPWPVPIYPLPWTIDPWAPYRPPFEITWGSTTGELL